MKKKNMTNLSAALYDAILTIVIMLVLTMFETWLLQVGKIEIKIMKYLVPITLGVSGMLASYVIKRIADSKDSIFMLVSAVVLAVIVWMIALMEKGSGIDAGQAGISTAILAIVKSIPSVIKSGGKHKIKKRK